MKHSLLQIYLLLSIKFLGWKHTDTWRGGENTCHIYLEPFIPQLFGQFMHVLWPGAYCYAECLIAELCLPHCLDYCTDLASDYHCISTKLVISVTCNPVSNVVDIWERFQKLEGDKVCDCTGSFPQGRVIHKNIYVFAVIYLVTYVPKL